MKLNPFLNASLASLYILCIVSTMHVFAWVSPPEDGFLIPIVMLSLFVLSAAVMGYLFVYEPLLLHISGKAQEGIVFFGKTVLFFAGYAIFFALVMVLGGV